MEFIRVEACCEILDSQRKPVTESERVPGMYPYYGANGIQGTINQYIFDDKLVLVAEDGGHFGSKIKPIAYLINGKCWVNNHAHVLRAKKGFLAEYICYSLMFYKVEGYINGATRQKLTQAALRKLIIPKRSLEYQKAIVDRLDLVKCIIEKKQNIINELELLIKSRFVEIFKNNKAHIAIGELFQVIDGDRGKNYPKATDFFDEGYCLFLNAKNVTKNGFCFDTVQFITQQKDEQLNKGRVLPEDIILTTRGTVGNIAYCDIKSSHKHMRINSGMVILRSKDIIYDVDFITYVLSNQINYGKEISGSAQPQLPISKLKDIIIPFPEIFLQEDFGYLIKQINKLKFA